MARDGSPGKRDGRLASGRAAPAGILGVTVIGSYPAIIAVYLPGH